MITRVAERLSGHRGQVWDAGCHGGGGVAAESQGVEGGQHLDAGRGGGRAPPDHQADEHTPAHLNVTFRQPCTFW